ncbi:MAG: putative glutamyl-tRNA synthetase [Actinomycetia bacterium]|nr:putative glutamyl-tRNA synthetase [Actinomycetes bacterium]
MAPSPTGFFHVGSVRTTLYNWLYARQQHGTFVLRIEDTDAERNREEWVDGIYDALRWLGLDWDELYRQSERSELYAAAAAKLEADGRAYWCDCTREDTDARAKERGGPPGYDGFCRDRGLGAGEGRALRFRTPDEGTTVVPDVVRGDPSFENSTVEDFVLVRANGGAMFILANVVDDGDMDISHVLRGEEHLPNTPKYLLLWDALGYGQHPVFAHLPVLVNEKRQKLSKRRDPVALEQYRDEGYLPEVMLNYLALVGWSAPDNRERMTVAEMIELFRLEDIGKSPGFFDVAKLRAFNGDSIRELPLDDFVERALPFVRREPWGETADVDTFRRLAPLVQERVAVLGEVPAMVDFVFLDEPPEDEASWAKAMKEGAADILDATAAAYAEAEWKADVLKDALIAVGEGLGLKLAKTQAPVRVAVTGRTVGPPLFESMEVLGRETTLARIATARARLP